jgi:hypothetical protein
VTLARFPGRRAAPVPIGVLRCVECGAPPMIFVPGERQGVPHVGAFCGPLCAAGCGVEPWASADLVDRAGWVTRAELDGPDPRGAA